MPRRRASSRKSAPGDNIPSELTTFVGRTREIREIKGLLAACRLVTLIGAGGCGKTRLALRVARESAPRYSDGTWFVELAAVRNPDLVPRAIADALGVQEEAGQSILQTLTAHFIDRQTLLVLDNCEHLAVACATVLDALLRHAPGLRVLVTSREPLRMSGETAWRVPSLDLAGAELETEPTNLAKIEAIRLFLDRATARHSAFTLTPENAQNVVDICQRLDGIPLAIELAAALVPTLSVDTILHRLDHALQLLVGGTRVVPRQETLRATIDWSFDLVGDSERRIMRRLAVFAGSFSVEAIEGVVPDDASAAALALAGLTRLVDASLVITAGPGVDRYRLLEPVRQYAMEKLIGSGELGGISERHARYFMTVGEQCEPFIRTGQSGRWLQQLDDDLENIRVALDWCLRTGTSESWEMASRLATALRWYWVRAARVGEGGDWLKQIQARSDGLSRRSRARVTASAGLIAWLGGDEEAARQWLGEGAELHRDARDQAERAFALAIRGMVDEPGADPGPSEQRLDESVRLFTEIGDEWGRAVAAQVRALRSLRRGEHLAARESMERALALFRQVGDAFFVAQVLNSLGDLARSLGEDGRAAARYRESLDFFQRNGRRAGIPSILHNLGHVALHQGDARRAAELFRESLSQFHQQGDRRGMAECLAGLAGTLADEQPRRAAWLIGAAQTLLNTVGATIWPSNEETYEKTMRTIRARSDAGTIDVDILVGRAAAWSEVSNRLNEIPFAPRPAHRRTTSPRVATDPDALTPREREVAALVARGMSNRQIAVALVISSGTATLHVKRILGKLGFGSRAAIAAWAVDHDLTDRSTL